MSPWPCSVARSGWDELSAWVTEPLKDGRPSNQRKDSLLREMNPTHTHPAMNLQSVRQVTGGVRTAAIQMLKELESSCLLSWDHWGKGESCPRLYTPEAARGTLLGSPGPSVCEWLLVLAMKHRPGDHPGHPWGQEEDRAANSPETRLKLACYS